MAEENDLATVVLSGEADAEVEAPTRDVQGEVASQGEGELCGEGDGEGCAAATTVTILEEEASPTYQEELPTANAPQVADVDSSLEPQEPPTPSAPKPPPVPSSNRPTALIPRLCCALVPQAWVCECLDAR
jgi:hypothetical protein